MRNEKPRASGALNIRMEQSLVRTVEPDHRNDSRTVATAATKSKVRERVRFMVAPVLSTEVRQGSDGPRNRNRDAKRPFSSRLLRDAASVFRRTVRAHGLPFDDWRDRKSGV